MDVSTVGAVTGTSAADWGAVSGRRTAALYSAYLALALLLALPMMLVEIPMGVDTLNHLARIHIQAHIGGDADLARLFEVQGGLIPYMGFDWLLVPMARVMPTLVAGRVFVVLLLWATVGGVVLLQRVFTGRVGFEPLLAGLVSYNALMAWGFLPYLLGAAGAMYGLAAWHGLRQRPWAVRLLLAAAVATSLYFAHLLALVVYGAMLGAYEVFGRPQAWRTPMRDWALLGLQFGPAAALWLSLPAPLQLGAQPGLAWLLNIKGFLLSSPFVFSVAGPEAGLELLTAVLCLALLLHLSRAGLVRWTRALAAPAIALAVLGVIAPGQMVGALLVDLRFPTSAACLALAALRASAGSGWRLLPAGLAAAAFFLVQIGSAATEMQGCDRQFGEVREALATVPRGAVLTAVLEEEHPAPGVPCSHPLSYFHVSQLVTLERSGYSPDFFAYLKPVSVRNGLLADAKPLDAASLTSAELPLSGYILWMHFGNRARPVPPGLATLHRGSFFDIYAVL